MILSEKKKKNNSLLLWLTTHHFFFFCLVIHGNLSYLFTISSSFCGELKVLYDMLHL